MTLGIPDMAISLAAPNSDSKIFLEQAFADFSNRKFGLELADPRSFF